MTVTSLADVDRRIEALGSTLERTRANLVELDLDMTRQMLASSTTLRGRTAERWRSVAGDLVELWQGQLALDDLFEQVTRERAARGASGRTLAAGLAERLDGASVTLAHAEVTGHSLTAGPAQSEVHTVDDVLARMSMQYESAAQMVGAVAAVWNDALPALGALAEELADLDAAATSSGARRPNELATTRHTVADAEETARCDPLAFETATLAPLAATVERTAGALRQALRAQQEVAAELESAAGAVEEGERALRRARDELERVAERVVVPAEMRSGAERAEADLAELRAELGAVGGAPAAGVRAQALQILQRATRVGQQAGELEALPATLLAARDELRGRLEAYRAKALARGAGEDLDLEALHDLARDSLYSAPCDLPGAQAQVSAYQARLRTLGEGR